MVGNPIATRQIEVPSQNSANSLLVVLARQVPASPRFFSPSLPDFFLSAARFSEKKTSRCRIVSFLAVRLSLRCIAERRKGGNYGVRMPIERFKMPRKLCQTRYPTTERMKKERMPPKSRREENRSEGPETKERKRSWLWELKKKVPASLHACMFVCLFGWTDGCIDGCIDGWMHRLIDGSILGLYRATSPSS